MYEPMRSRYVSALNRIWRALRYMRWPEAPPLHRDEQFEPFFIVGSGRCGTTLLRRLLMESSEAHIPPENWRLKDVIPCFKRYRWTVEWNDLSRLAVNYFAHQGEYNPDKTINKWFDGRSLKPLIDELEAIPSEEQSLARLIDHLYRYHGRVHETKVLRWGDKTPLNVWNMNRISEVFPDAKFVHLLRDGTDVAASFINAGPPSLRESALRWKSAVEAARHFMQEHPARCIEIRYEDLVSQPTSSVRDICDYLSLRFLDSRDGIPSSENMEEVSKLQFHENVFEPVSSESVGKGHRRLSKKQKAEIQNLIGRELECYGYATP